MSEVVERAVDARLLTFPLRVWFGGKVERDLPRGFGKRHGQFAARVVIAKENFGDRRAPLRSREPSLHDRRHVLVDPVDTQRPAIQQYDNHRFTDRVNSLHEIQLTPGQIETRAAQTLTDSSS